MLRQLTKQELIQETYAGERYEYYPLGKHIVMAPGVCGGRPTFKYTRLEVSVVLADISTGHTIQEILDDFHLSNLSEEAIQEAINLARQAFIQTAQQIMPTAISSY